jgi:Carboxypeptidase regulatory-like domain/TonB-dependent Receptor Plug Domain
MSLFSRLNSNSTKILFALLIFLSLPILVTAQQETGQINGTISDPNGAVIANASVRVKNIDTGREITVQTSSEGTYLIPNLQPAIYEVVVAGQGFADKTERVQVTVGAKLTLNTQLGVTATNNTVDVVVGGLAEINTTDQQISSVVTGKQITELPTLTRNPYDLVTLSGNVSEADPSGRGAGVAINGQRSASTSILLDGAENVETFGAGIGQQTPLDSVGEFRVITSNFSAEYGRASGGIVNVVTRAGTNRYSGTLYEFNRVSKLASNSFDNNARGIARPVFTRNQFGYAIGGPLPFFNFGEGGPVFTSGKDKLFFFNSTEWTRVRSSDTTTAYVPTQGFINASNINTRNFFSQFGTLAPNVRRTGRTFLTDPRVGGGATPLFEEAQFSVPADAGGGFPQNSYSTVTRIDLNATDKTQLYGRYAVESNNPFSGNYDTSPYAGFTVGTTDFNQNGLISVTHQFSPNFVSQTKAAFNRLRGENSIGADPNTPTLSGNFGGPGGLSIYFPGFLSLFPGTGLPTTGTQNLFQINQDLTIIKENHNFRLGGQFIYIRDNKLFPAYQNASQQLGTNQASVINNFLNGNLNSFAGAVNPQGRFPGQSVTLPVSAPDFSRSNRYKEYALYFNDAWRVIPTVTLNLGVRYEFYGPQRNVDPALESNFYLGTGANVQERIRNGSVRTTMETGALWKNDNNNFAPRVGIAWDVFGNGRTSLRGGYGLAYERNFGNVTFNVIQNPPNYAVLTLTPADVGGQIPIYTNSSGPLGGNPGLTRTLGRVSLRAVDPDIVNAYAHFWSAAFEHQLSRTTIASVSYSGSAGRDLYSISNINRVGAGLRYLNSTTSCAGLTPAASNRLNCQYTDINFRSNGGYSNYSGVTASLDSNDLFGLGLTVTNRYTYSVTKDNVSSTFTDGYQSNSGARLGFLDPFDPSLDYGNADFDVRHRFISSFVWDIGAGKKYGGDLTRKVLGGLQLTGQVNIQSGSPFTIFDSTPAERAYTFLRLTPTAPINFGAPDNLTPTSNPNEFIYTNLQNQTPSTFRDVSGGTDVGPYPTNMTDRNAFRGPGYWNVNLGLYKTVSFSERYKLQLRAETFNVFNHANLFINGGTVDLGSSSEVTASRDGRRNIQLAVKFLF